MGFAEVLLGDAAVWLWGAALPPGDAGMLPREALVPLCKGLVPFAGAGKTLDMTELLLAADIVLIGDAVALPENVLMLPGDAASLLVDALVLLEDAFMLLGDAAGAVRGPPEATLSLLCVVFELGSDWLVLLEGSAGDSGGRA